MNNSGKRIKNLRVAFVVDECHRAVTPRTQRILSEFFVNSLWYGFTGTPRFDVNAYPAEGDLPRTTQKLYGKCLHKYTVREAIRDEAVLGFVTEHLGPDKLDDKDSNEDLSVYDSETHRKAVLDVILNKSREKLGFRNGRGQTYEGILTVRSIKIAQAYYDLLKKVKNGESDLKISEETKRVLPDFPKFAITYSVSADADDESTEVNVPKMKESLDDYNQMFGTTHGIGDIKGYNADLNNRLARKQDRFKNRAEQLDLIIVVNRLLTGFDAPCLSTVFIDRQPMHPHDIIQTFSRTNRLFNKNKLAGQIVTFQSPHVFKQAVDDALILYSAGGAASALAPDWETSLEKFKKELAYLRLTAETPEAIGTFALPQKKRFAKAFQEFDKAYANLKAFTKYSEKDPDEYGITQDEYERYVAWYLNIREELKNNDKGEEQQKEEEPDLEYDLRAYSKEKIDYDYIMALIQLFADATEEEKQNPQYVSLVDEVTSYIDDLAETNPKMHDLMSGLWEDIQKNPEQYKDQKVSYLLEEMRHEAICANVQEFAEEWFVPDQAVMYAAEHMDIDSESIPGLNNIKETADYAGYKEKHGDVKKYQYNKALRESLKMVLCEDIIPLRDSNYRKDKKIDKHYYISTNSDGSLYA